MTTGAELKKDVNKVWNEGLAGSIMGSNTQRRTVVTDVTTKGRAAGEQLPALRDCLNFNVPAKVVAVDNCVTLSVFFQLDPRLLGDARFFIHWGSYHERPERWSDLPVQPEDIEQIGPALFLLRKSFLAERMGHYGATAFAMSLREPSKIWLGSPSDDARFSIASDSFNLLERLEATRYENRRKQERVIFERIGSYRDLESTLGSLSAGSDGRDLARIMHDTSKHDKQLRNLLSAYHFQAMRKLELERGEENVQMARRMSQVLQNIGIGEIVLVSPEGPHAIAGGLAQVMNGLLKSFSEQGITVTLISPLYEQKRGNEHESADELLRTGVEVNGENMELHWCGEVEIPFGPTFAAGTKNWVQHAYKEKVVVYKAGSGNTQLIFLRHARYADRLYANVMPDEQLRRAIFLSRGALEVLKNPIFGIHPQLILSNDWLTALVPVFHKLDLRYSCDEKVRDCKTVHLMHNCGKDYHGRIPAHHSGQYLFPMLEISLEHYYGLADPHDSKTLNLTAGAVFHLNGALLAVSKPYARQLLTWQDGEGLNELLAMRRDAVFGISNGIDQFTLRKKITAIGENALVRLGQQAPVKRNGHDPFFENLVAYKNAAKHAIQEDLGLEQDSDRLLISFIGRIAEQKGVSLLTGWPAGEGVTVLESILWRYPQAQFVVAGPVVDGDRTAGDFRRVVEHLSWKFGGRIRGIFEFVPHEYALKIFLASDFYVMPSRYEPGGLTQLEALAAGSLVVARKVGGIVATLTSMHDCPEQGNSFLFDDYTPTALRDQIMCALDWTADKGCRAELSVRAAQAKHDWSHRVPEYLSVFQYVAGVLDPSKPYRHLQPGLETLARLRP